MTHQEQRAGLAVWRAALRPARWTMVGLAAAVVVDAVANVAIPLLIREIFDVALPASTSTYLQQLLGFGLMVLALGAGSQVALAWTLARADARVLTDLQGAVFRAVEHRPLGDLRRASRGEISQQATSDLDQVERVLTEALPRVLRGVLLGVPSLVLMFIFEWQLSICVIAALSIVYLGARLLSAPAQAASEARRDSATEVVDTIREALDGQPVIRAYSLAQHMRQQFTVRQDDLHDRIEQQILLGQLVAGATNIALYAVTVVTLGLGAWMVYGGSVSSGVLVGFLALFMPLSRALNELSEAMPVWLRAHGSVLRIAALLREDAELRDSPPPPVPPLAEALRLRGVVFRYPGQARPALAGVDLVVARGSSVALVGPSGAGKSTLMSLLLGFEQPQEGQVTWDSHALGSTREAHLAHVGVVFQTPWLFEASIGDNIRMGRLDASEAEIVSAARAAQAHEFISRLPGGYDTRVGANAQLSGGQIQRIALARAMVRDPDILILDEPTAALDPHAESIIHDTLEALRDGRTIVHSTHRLEAIRDYDLIVVMDDGKVVERGRHEELLAIDGVYHRLIQRMAGLEVSGDGRHAAVSPARLAEVPVFSQLGDEERSEVSEQLMTERFEAGDIVVKQGDQGDRFFFIVRGRLAVYDSDDADPDRLLRHLEPGDFFGEIALLEQRPRSATVVAKTQCSLLALSRHAFRELMIERPGLSKAIHEAASERLATSEAARRT